MSSTRKNVLGAVPSEWKVVELRDLGSWGGGKTPRKSNQEYWNGETPWISPKDMGGSVVHRTEDHVTQVALSEQNLMVYDPGSVMVVFRSGVLRHTFPVAICNRPFTVNQDMKVLSPGSEVDNRFAFYLIDHLGPVVLQKATKVGTTVESVDTDSFMSLSVGVPCLEEQHRIADVLDTVDAAIQETDSVVEKQEQVKTGLLQDLLTRGLDANGRLRDPEREPEAFQGTELGLIPESWEIEPCAKVLSMSNGKSKTQKELAEENGNIPVWGGNGKTGYCNDPLVSRRGIVIGRVGEYCGSVHLTDGPAWITDNAIFATVEADWALLDFTTLYLDWFDLSSKSTRTGQPLMTQTAVKEVPFLCPNLEEQQRIVDRVQSLQERKSTERTYQNKLHQLKIGLMQDLLTGRVRVPEVKDRVDEVVA